MTIFISFLGFATALVSCAIAIRAFRRGNLLRLHHDQLTQRVKQLEADRIRADKRFCVDKATHLLGRSSVSCESQHGEDAWLWEQFDFQPQGFYVEVGGHDGRTFSNSYFFEKLGWQGVVVEANPTLAESCQRSRPEATVVHAAVVADPATKEIEFMVPRGADGVSLLGFTSFDEKHVQRIHDEGGEISSITVPASTLDEILQNSCQGTVDFVSIDIEGAELDCLRGFDLQRWSPRFVLIEDNTGGANPAVPNHMQSNGYQLIKQIGCNLVFAATKPKSGS